MFVLASASPRRAELLRLMGLRFSTVTSHFDEESVKADTPEEYVLRSAEGKARAVQALCGRGDTVIGADTAVVIDGRILGKPKSREDAVFMLLSLSGRTHRVLTAVCITDGEREESFLSESEVDFIPFDRETAERYALTGECDDKAGAYGVQGKGSVLVSAVRGDIYSVIGLPVCETALRLKGFGFNLFE